MTESSFSNEQLICYLDEALPNEEMVQIEQELRNSESLRNRLASLIRERDQGGHTVGEIWRRQRLSCPTRQELGNFILGTLTQNELDYIDFHIRSVGCRYCQANLSDLETQNATPEETTTRRRKFFQSSAGYLKSNK